MHKVEKTKQGVFYFCSLTLTLNVEFLSISYKNINMKHTSRLRASVLC